MHETRLEHDAPIPQQENTKLAMWLFLGGEVVFFVSLILLIIFTRLTIPGYDKMFRSHLSIPLIALNTFVLVASSYFVVRALEAIKHEGSGKAMARGLWIVAALGLVFLGGQAFEWTALLREGVGLSSPFGSAFFTVTGIHGTHVFVGILWVAYLLSGNRRIPFTRESSLAIENFGLYWHFVDIVWIVLFTVIYLI